MSSLMQFNGPITRQGVHLRFYHVTPSQKFMDYPQYDPETGKQIGTKREYYLKDTAQCGDETDGIFMPGGKFYPRLWTAIRKPCGMLGCWVQFRINGQIEVPDLSVPIATFKLPRDARPLSNEETIKEWTT